MSEQHNLIRLMSLALGSLVACDDSSPSEIIPSAKVVASSTMLELPQGGEGFIVFEVQRTPGHTAPVGMTVEGAPSGMFAAFHPPLVTTLVNHSSLTVAVGPTVAPGTHALVAHMSADWLDTRQVPITVHVAVPQLDVSIANQPVVFEQMHSVSTLVAIERGGFLTAPVALSARDLPPGVTARFDPNTIPAGQNTSTLTLTSSLDTPVQMFAATLRANAPSIQIEIPLQISVLPTTTPSVVLGAVPAVISIKAGEEATAIISATRFGGYTGTLTYDVSGTPSLVLSEVVPTSESGDSALLKVRALETAHNGSAHLTVRATGPGIEPSTTVVTLHVARVQ